MKVFASCNSNENIRMRSSSGGVFQILAKAVIDSGGVVYGAAFNNRWQVTHIRIEDEADINKLLGSKYVYSTFASSVDMVLQDLSNNKKVLFSGTPCQIAAVRKRCGNNPNLLLIEVICHGAPSPEYWGGVSSSLM